MLIKKNSLSFLPRMV